MPYAQQIATVNLQSMILYMIVAEMLIAIPAGMVLKRIGFSAWWAILCFMPILALAASDEPSPDVADATLRWPAAPHAWPGPSPP